jgi:hypothetical protein
MAMGFFPMAWLAGVFAGRHVALRAVSASGAMAILFAFGLFLCAPGLLRRTASIVTHQVAISGTDFPMPMNDAPTNSVGGCFARLWTLRSLPDALVVQTQNTNGVEVNVPSGSNRLWDAPLPAAQRLHPYLQMRGATLNAGFRVTQPSGWIRYVPYNGNLNAKT